MARQARHIKWNEIQMNACGVCESPSIVETTKGLYWTCTSCWSTLYKPSTVKRGLVWTVEPDRDEEGICIDGTGSGLRKETDEEMRLRTVESNKSYGEVADGVVVLKKRYTDEHKDTVLYGGEENQIARMLKIVLKNEKMADLKELTDELARLKRLEESLWAIPEESRTYLLECASAVDPVNPTVFYGPDVKLFPDR